MKKITLNYNDKGYICNTYDDGEFYIAQQEDKAVIISATFPGNLVGSVNAYVKSGSGGDVIENCGTIDINKHTVELDLDSKHLAYNYLKVGFEVKTSTKEIRFEPLTLEVDEFVNVTGSSAPSPYTVSVKVGNVTQLESDEEPTITNSGNNKHLVLNFGIPKGDKGDTGEQGIPGKDGYTPVKGKDYFTAEDIASLGIENKADKAYVDDKVADIKESITDRATVDYVDYIVEGAYLDLENRITDRATVDYVDQTVGGIHLDLQNMISKKVDKVSGRGLSEANFTNAEKEKLSQTNIYTNEEKDKLSQTQIFTNDLKTRLENNTFDGFITAEYNEETDEYEFDFDNLNIEGIYLLYKPERSDDVAYTYYILTVNAAHDGTDTVQFLLNLKNGEMESRQDFGRWQKISVSQTDLKDATKGFATTTDIDNAIGDVETSLENIIQKYGLGGDGV